VFFFFWGGTHGVEAALLIIECHIIEFIKDKMTLLGFFFLEIKNRIPVCDTI